MKTRTSLLALIIALTALPIYTSLEGQERIRQMDIEEKKLEDAKKRAKRVYRIGGRGPGGGYVFYDKGTYSGGWRYLEAAPKDQGDAPWGCYGKEIRGAYGFAFGSGKRNTAAIVQACRETGIAARVARAYRGGGKGDWFLPSKDELNLMYQNLKQRGVGGFAGYSYWSSSENNAYSAWFQSFDDGSQSLTTKSYAGRVRAVRAF